MSTERRSSNSNKIIIGVIVALSINFFSNYFLMTKSLTQIETELVYIRKGFTLAQLNASKLDKREGFINTTLHRLNYIESRLKVIK